jgi:hypothetical protein
MWNNLSSNTLASLSPTLHYSNIPILHCEKDSRARTSQRFLRWQR